MNISNDELGAIRDWVRLQSAQGGTQGHAELIKSTRPLDLIFRSDPERSLEAIKKILEVSSDDWILTNLGAGPLEDVLSWHGDKVMASIEQEARQNENLRKALGFVWKGRLSPDVWERVRACVEGRKVR